MPIIVGSPRSGTTLLRFMLDSHPDLAIPPETGFFWTQAELETASGNLREEFFRAVTNYPSRAPSWPDFEILEETFWKALEGIEPFNLPDGYRTFYRLYAARFEKPRWGDKTPTYCLSLDAIRELIPEARFIHLIRDGRDAALSLRKMWFSPGWEIETQANFWRDCVVAARRAGLNSDDYLEVRYEDLVLETPNTLQRICKFINLPYHDAMLTYYMRSPERLREHKGRQRPDGTMLMTQVYRIRQQERVMEPPDPDCVFGWRRAMSDDEKVRFGLIAGDLLDELGYEV